MVKSRVDFDVDARQRLSLTIVNGHRPGKFKWHLEEFK